MNEQIDACLMKEKKNQCNIIWMIYIDSLPMADRLVLVASRVIPFRN